MANKRAGVAVGKDNSISDVPVHQDRKKIIAIVVVTVVVVLLIAVLMFMGKGKFAGKAIDVGDLTKTSEGTIFIPVAKGSFMTVGTQENFPVYVKFKPEQEGYVFGFEVSYNPQLMEYKGIKDADSNGYIASSGIFVTEEKTPSSVGIKGFRIDDPSDPTKAPPSLNTLKDSLGNVLLVTLLFSPKSSGNGYLQFESRTFLNKDNGYLEIGYGNQLYNSKNQDDLVDFEIKPLITVACDGQKIEGAEACDGLNFKSGEGICPAGTTGSVKCSSDCNSIDLNGCVLVSQLCGNTKVDANEECDKSSSICNQCKLTSLFKQGDINLDSMLDSSDQLCYNLVNIAKTQQSDLPQCMAVSEKMADLNCDGVVSVVDVSIINQLQLLSPAYKLPKNVDNDGDYIVDCKDEDDDNDGVLDLAVPEQVNEDGDIITPAVKADNCPLVPNPDQKDSNNNGIGDACDTAKENCIDLIDNDNDGKIDCADGDCENGKCSSLPIDTDSDGVPDAVDFCPTKGKKGSVFVDGSNKGCVIGDSDKNGCVVDEEIASAIDDFYAGVLTDEQISAAIDLFLTGEGC